MVVHPRFKHFLHMLWFIGKIDSIIRSMVRCWLHERASAFCGGTTEECQQFVQDSSDEIWRLGLMFSHAVAHIELSLQKASFSSSSSAGSQQ